MIRAHLRSRVAPRTLALATVASLLLAARAEAKLVDLHGGLLAGGMTGGGSSTPRADVFGEIQGGGLGTELGVRLLVLDLSIRFIQMAGVKGHHGTLLSAMFGPSVEIPVVGGGVDMLGRPRPPKVLVRPSIAGGFGFATLGPVSIPITNEQLDSKGLLVVGRFAVERMYGRFWGLGGSLEGGYHYFFGANSPINGPDHSNGWQLAAFGTVTFHLGV